MPRWSFVLLPLLLACAPAVLSPSDPEKSAQISALGSEAANVPRGPLHRPGQPCALCHDGGEAPEFSVAGTMFRDDMGRIPLVDADVIMVDSAKRRFTTHTNCVGNFYLSPNEFDPVVPFWVTVVQGANVAPMESPINRERSCAGCHFDPVGPRAVGHAYLTADELVAPTIPTRACRPDEGRR